MVVDTKNQLFIRYEKNGLKLGPFPNSNEDAKGQEAAGQWPKEKQRIRITDKVYAKYRNCQTRPC